MTRKPQMAHGLGMDAGVSTQADECAEISDAEWEEAINDRLHELQAIKEGRIKPPEEWA